MLIFLDLDGVMIPMKSWVSPNIELDGFPSFSIESICAINSLINEKTTIILTTSHKSNYTIEEWIEIFNKRNINISHIKCLDENLKKLNRKDEIIHWFNLNKVDDTFVIIDDDRSLNDLPKHIKEKLYLINSMIGLKSDDVINIKKILNI